MNVDLKEEKPPDFGCFLSTHGLFSIKIKVSFNAEIFLMGVPYRLIHDWLLILMPKEVTSFFICTWMDCFQLR